LLEFGYDGGQHNVLDSIDGAVGTAYCDL
jgi:hypothetical protein